MPNTLPISSLIDVQVNLTPQAAQAQDLSNLLLLGSSNVIDVVERLRIYDSIDAVAADFGTTAPEYLGAVLWFEQAPQPNQIEIGRWAKTATHAILQGATLSAAGQLIAAWNAVATPAFTIYIDAIPFTISPATFAAATNLNAIAALIQTALAAQVANSTCVWDAVYQRFEIQSGTTGATSLLSFATSPHANGYITFAANPLNNATITLNGTAVTFVNAGPVGNQVLIAGTLAGTLANLLTFLNASVNAGIITMTYSINPANTRLYCVAVAAGAGGNALTLAASLAVPSGATLSGGSGTDISAMLGALSTSGGYIAQGIAAESAVVCVGIMDATFGQQWYATVIPEAVDADHLAVAAYIQASANKHIYGVTTQEAGAISSVSTTDIAYLLSAAEYSRTVCQYSSSNPYAVCSLLGRALTVDYNGNSTVITLMYKQEPGITPENINASQAAALDAKNANAVVAYNNDTAIIQYGKVCSGDFIDIITGTDWLAVTIMTALFNLLYTSPTKIPQTDAGNHMLFNTTAAVCSQGVANGLLAPGVWNAAGFGQLQQGDYIPDGFYIYMQPIGLQSQANREARMSVPVQVAAKLAGAVQTVDVLISVNR